MLPFLTATVFSRIGKWVFAILLVAGAVWWVYERGQDSVENEIRVEGLEEDVQVLEDAIRADRGKDLTDLERRIGLCKFSGRKWEYYDEAGRPDPIGRCVE